ncbi:MAG: hypothetical protein V1660_02060 [archaeon]
MHWLKQFYINLLAALVMGVTVSLIAGKKNLIDLNSIDGKIISAILALVVVLAYLFLVFIYYFFFERKEERMRKVRAEIRREQREKIIIR